MALSAQNRRDLLKSGVGASGNRVALAIELAGLTQAEVAAAVELTQPYISDVARGRHSTITLDNARKFADFFGCAIEDLFPSREKSAEVA